MNLMKTFKYGGRKTPPTKDELSQLVVRNTTFNLLSHSKPVQFVQLYCALFPLRQDVFSLSNYTVMRISNFLQEKRRKKKVFKQVFMFLFFFFFLIEVLLCFFLQQGRQTKRQVFLLPGCSRMLKVQTSSVSNFIHACFVAK